MSTKDPTVRVLEEIAKGTHDGNLMKIVEALSERGNTGERALLWRITLNDDTWDAETVTIGELRRVEAMAGKPYLLLDPSKSMRDFSALVVAHYMADGLSQDEAFEKADAITQPEALAALELYEGSLGKD